MLKTKKYSNTHFNADIIKAVIDAFIDKSWEKEKITSYYNLENDGVRWRYDDENEFFSDYRKEHRYSRIDKDYSGGFSLSIIYFNSTDTEVAIGGDSRGKIESVFDVFERNLESSKNTVDKDKIQAKIEPIIFIGHGRSQQWRDLKDHLSEKHGYVIEAYETGARAGHTIRDILDDMANKSSFALLVMTGEDKDEQGNLKARPNVIHEVGLFQGKLGFSRAIVLLEEGTDEFSNLYGIQQIRYSKNNIKETFGEVLATLKREFDL